MSFSRDSTRSTRSAPSSAGFACESWFPRTRAVRPATRSVAAGGGPGVAADVGDHPARQGGGHVEAIVGRALSGIEMLRDLAREVGRRPRDDLAAHVGGLVHDLRVDAPERLESPLGIWCLALAGAFDSGQAR